MTKYKKLTVEVTQEHINKGTPVHCNDCAMSLAFSDALLKINDNKCLVTTRMSNGEVTITYSKAKIGLFEDVNLKEYVDDFTSNLQYKIDAFVNEYDNSFLSSHGHNTMPLADFTPRYCVPFTFDVRLPV